MNTMEVFTFKKADGTSEITVSINPEIVDVHTGETHDPKAAEKGNPFRVLHCPLAITLAVLAAASVAIGWAWNTIHVRTATLANGQVEIAAFSFDGWPVAFAIVASIFAIMLAVQSSSRYRFRILKLAAEERRHHIDANIGLIEKALEFARPAQPKTPGQSKWSISITVNKNSDKDETDNSAPCDPSSSGGSPRGNLPSGNQPLDPSPSEDKPQNLPPSGVSPVQPVCLDSQCPDNPLPGESVYASEPCNGQLPEKIIETNNLLAPSACI